MIGIKKQISYNSKQFLILLYYFTGKSMYFCLKIDEMQELSKLAKEAKLKTSEWKNFFRKNKHRLMKMDREIARLHEEVSSEIDCLQCGNCCRELGPMIMEKDMDVLSKKLRISSSNFIEKYLKKDEDGDWVFESMPCPFLGADNYCAVYEKRPKACREYPHTDRKKFYQIYDISIKNASVCPIAFTVLEKLKEL